MAAITTRQTAGTGATVKNAPLTNAEIDNNFINLNTDLSNAVYLSGTQSIGGAKTFTNNVNINGTSSGAILAVTNSGTGVGLTVDDVVISANSTTDALRITQIGTGNAILVEDEANPDSTPFLVNATGQVGAGATPATWAKLTVGGMYPSGNNFAIGNYTIGTVPAAATQEGVGFWSELSTQATTFSTTLSHFVANQGGFGAGSTVANQHGFRVSSTLIGATNNYGFHSNIPSGTGRWNFYASGTADNYFAGKVGIGAVPAATSNVRVSGTVTGNVNQYGVLSELTAASDVTSILAGFTSSLNTAASVFTLTNLRHFLAGFNAIGAGSTVTNQFGFFAGSNLTGATNNYGFYSDLASGTGRWNFFANGTADNYFGGPLKVGQTYYSNTALGIFWAPAATSATGIYQDSTINSATTTSYVLNSTFPTTAAASFTLPTLVHYQAAQNTFGAGSTVTNQFGFRVNSNLIGATNNYAFYSDIASGTGRWNFYANGTAPNYFAGNVTVAATTTSTSATTGALVVSGGVGVGENVYISKSLIVGTTLSTGTGIDLNNNNIVGVNAITFADPGPGEGISFSGNFNIYESPDDLTTNSAGNLQFVSGGARRLTVKTSGQVEVTATTASTSTTTGALVVGGGVGIAGALNATTKSFIIDHPTKPNTLLKHGSLEGPEFGVYVRGRTSSKIIELPEYWTKLVDPATITVNLTPIGNYQKLYVEKIESNCVYINGDDLLSNSVDCFYTVFAERCDVEKLQVEVSQ